MAGNDVLGNEATYSRLGADLRSTSATFPVEVSLDRVVQEKSILVEVILGLLLSKAVSLGEGLTRGL